MFRENATEMKQMLLSLKRVADYKVMNENSNNRNVTKFESHIFFDGGCNGENILHFGVQLLSLIPDTLGVELDQVKRYITPYGCRYEWTIQADEDDDTGAGMPFVFHFKDNNKVKNKKRWSKVMYMNYVINTEQGRMILISKTRSFSPLMLILHSRQNQLLYCLTCLLVILMLVLSHLVLS